MKSVRKGVVRNVLGGVVTCCVWGVLVASVVTGCATEPRDETAKANLASEASAALQAFKNEDPTLDSVLGSAAGYAVFPSVGKAGAFGLGGSWGRGEVFEKGAKVGYCDITAGTVGLQLGAQTFDELIVFKKQDSLDHFKQGKFAFAANASAVAIKAGGATAADYSGGAAVFVRHKGGLMVEAAIGAQRFTFKAY